VPAIVLIDGANVELARNRTVEVRGTTLIIAEYQAWRDERLRRPARVSDSEPRSAGREVASWLLPRRPCDTGSDALPYVNDRDRLATVSVLCRQVIRCDILER
jgi:hypothetical protein